MSTKTEKAALRQYLLKKRDGISFELKKISSQKIHQKLKENKLFNDAKKIACYYSIGSEVMTTQLINDIMKTKSISLPKIVDDKLVFKQITNLEKLERGPYEIMEPRDDYETVDDHDIIIVPTIGITRFGDRLGYGFGYYDRYLSGTNTKTISLTFAQQIIKSIPNTENDVKIDWIISEEESFGTK